MQVTETLSEGLKRGYEIKLTSKELDKKVTEDLMAAQPDMEMKGFRKGKVPLALMKKKFGEQVMGEAMQKSIDEAMANHLKETGDRPAQQPVMKMKSETWKPGDDVEVAVSYEKLPDLPEIDFKKIKLERLSVKATDDDVSKALSELAGTSKDFVDRKKGAKAKNDDQVIIDFVGKVDGEIFDGGTGSDYPLVLGSNSFIPGFEEQLIGAKVGEKVEVKVNFPEDYQAENLKGKAAIFDCTLKGVKQAVPAEINDDLAKRFGADDLKGLNQRISDSLEQEYAGAARSVMKRKLLDKLAKSVKIDLPPSLVEAEASQIAHQLWHEENPEVQGHDHPEIETKDEHTELAKRRVGLGLIVAELGRKNDIEVTEAEISQAVMNQARQYPGQEKQFFDFMKSNPQMQEQVRAPIFEDKVIDFIFELVEVSEKTVKKGDLEKAVKKLEES
jgi:trigger factor